MFVYCTQAPCNPLFRSDQRALKLTRALYFGRVELLIRRVTRCVPVVSNGSQRRFHICSSLLVACDLFLP